MPGRRQFVGPEIFNFTAKGREARTCTAARTCTVKIVYVQTASLAKVISESVRLS